MRPSVMRVVSLLVVFATLNGCEDRIDARSSNVQNKDSSTPAPLAPEVSAPDHGDPSPALHAGIEPPVVGDGTYRVDPFIAAHLYSLLAHDAGRPWLERTPPGAAAAGFRITGSPPLTLFEALGLRTGDVVEALNGVAIAHAPDVRASLRNATNEVRVTCFRDGASFTNSYRFVGGLAWARITERLADSDASAAGADVTEVAISAPREPDAPPANTPRAASPSKPPGSSPSKLPASSASRSPASAPSTSTPSRSAPSASASAPVAARPASGVVCPSSGRCTLPKATFDRLVANPQRLQSEVKTAPAIRNDVFSGYWIRGVPRGSTVADLGFRVDDKITHVNGYFLGDDAQALALYLSLPQARSFSIRYERNGKPLTKVVAVK